MGMEKSAISVIGVPEVHGEVAGIAGGIVQELRTSEMGIAAKELYPRTLGAIGFFKAYAISRLDFEVPEDYKHRCPIFCSAAFQDNFIGEVWCAGRVKRSDWIISGIRIEFTQSYRTVQ